MNAFLGQVPLAPFANARPYGYAPPELSEIPDQHLGSSHPPPPGVCCQARKNGGTVCSDGFIGPAG